MSKRLILEGSEARERLATGVDKVANIVKKTLGVKGRNVALDTDRYRMPLLTNDGVSIARQIHDDDDAVELGIKLIKEAAAKTEDNAGDGTTTTMIIMQAILAAALEESGDPLEIRKAIEESANAVVERIKQAAKPAKDEDTLSYAATISCRDEKIGRMVARAVHKAGDDGMITLEDNLGGKTVAEEIEGVQLRAGYIAKQFINNPALNQIVATNPAFLVSNLTLTSPGELNHIGELALQTGYKVLIVMAQDFSSEFIMWCHINWTRHDSPLKVLPVRVNTAADIADGILRDVAAVTGSRFIDTFIGDSLETIDQESFGRAKKFVQTKHETTVLPQNKQHVEDRIKDLKAELKSAQDYQAENIRERIARLRQACFTIKVGGSTETELKERKTRVQDALNSARAAQQHGVVTGGGIALMHASFNEPMIMRKACYAPSKQLAVNSGLDDNEWRQAVAADHTILDPAKVVIESVINATAQAIQIMLCESLVIDPKVNEELA